MTRSRFLLNGGIIRQNMRQHGWIGIIYLLGLLFVLPLQMLLNFREDQPPLAVDSLFDIAGSAQMLFIITLPVAAGLFQFRYLQAKQPSDLWHSLPLKREQLLASHMTSGLLLLLVPVWLTSALSALLMPMDVNAYLFQGAEVWSWCLSVTVITLFFYAFSIFVGICTGQSVLQGIIIYILLILPAALLVLLNLHLSMYLFGYSGNFGYLGTIDNWSPLTKMMDIGVDPFTPAETGIYALLSVLFIGLSFGLYRKRHAEKTGHAIAFSYFNPLFKAGVMFCAMLLSGTYFGSLKEQTGWIIAGYAAGALIGYIAAEMVIRKSWHILSRKAVIEWAVYAALLGVVIYIPVSGWSGYENRVPAEDRIAGVYVGNDYHILRAGGNAQDALTEAEGAFTEDKDYIEAVRKLHQALVTARPGEDAWNGVSGSRYYTIAYKLNNGRELVRSYRIPGAGFEPELKAVMESEGFKRKQYMVYGLGEEVESFRISNRNKVVSISDPAEIAELKVILEREIVGMS